MRGRFMWRIGCFFLLMTVIFVSVVALLGWTMFFIWYQRRGSRGAVAEAVDPVTTRSTLIAAAG